MGCALVALGVVVPRVFLAVAFLFTDWLSRAYETVLWPLLGFLLLPYTTVAYLAAMLHNNGSVSGWWLVLVVLAVCVDLGHHQQSGRTARKRRS